jgi:hypothetical protein
MSERQPIPIPEPQRTPHEGGNGAPGLPRTVHESAKPPPPESRAYPTLPQKSALNRAVERTRIIYERNQWVFLPLESPTLPFRPPTTIFSAPSVDHLLEEPKKVDKNQPPHEEGKDPPKVPQSHNETKRQPLDPIARAMREAARREGIDPQALIQEVDQRLQQMLADHDPREARELQRMFDIPPDPSAPSPEELQRMFDVSSADDPTSDDHR